MMSAPAAPDRPKWAWNWWIKQRSSRREYWIYVAVILLVSFIGPPIVGYGALLALILTQVRRLHDFNASGWWAAAATLFPVVAFALTVVTTLENAALAGSGIVLVLIIVIGAIPGSPGENRFGPPPPVTWRRILTGR